MKELIFSQSKKAGDFIVTPIRGSGPGGQNKNKNFTGRRITHKHTGLYAEATDSKSSEQNLKNAFLRLVKSAKFKMWYNEQLLEIEHGERMRAEVERMMHPNNILVEVKDENGRWINEE